jgi:hypothetical protein
METSREYMLKLKEAIQSNYQNWRSHNYTDLPGQKKFAREFGFGLNDFKDRKEVEDTIKSSYSTLYICLFGMSPLMNAKEWMDEIRSELR